MPYRAKPDTTAAQYSKSDITRANPSKFGDVDVRHNLYDVIGRSLFHSFKEGNLTKEQLLEMLEYQASIRAEVDLGRGYGMNLGYNVPSGIAKTDKFNITFTKDLTDIFD